MQQDVYGFPALTAREAMARDLGTRALYAVRTGAAAARLASPDAHVRAWQRRAAWGTGMPQGGDSSALRALVRAIGGVL